MKKINPISHKLEWFTHRFIKWTGSAWGFSVALISMAVWLFMGILLKFSAGWENALSVYIGVVTFLMIFLLQRSQNKELSALHVKLNELIAATQHADNYLINAEELTEKEIQEVQETHRQIGTGNVT